MLERGASEAEVLEAIITGERVPAKRDRTVFRRNFRYERTWSGKFYRTKQVMPVVKEGAGHAIVITVYTFYF